MLNKYSLSILLHIAWWTLCSLRVMCPQNPCQKTPTARAVPALPPSSPLEVWKFVREQTLAATLSEAHQRRLKRGYLLWLTQQRSWLSWLNYWSGGNRRSQMNSSGTQCSVLPLVYTALHISSVLYTAPGPAASRILTVRLFSPGWAPLLCLTEEDFSVHLLQSPSHCCQLQFAIHCSNPFCCCGHCNSSCSSCITSASQLCCPPALLAPPQGR